MQRKLSLLLLLVGVSIISNLEVEAVGLFGVGGGRNNNKKKAPWAWDRNKKEHQKGYIGKGYGFEDFGTGVSEATTRRKEAALFRGGETAAAAAASVGLERDDVSPIGASSARRTGGVGAGHDVFVCVSTVNWGEFQQQKQAQSEQQKSTLVFTPGCRLMHAASSNKKSGGGSGDSAAEDWIGKGLWRDNSGPLWKSLAFLSDVLVLNVYERRSIDAELVQALEAGFAARMNDLPKSRLLMVLHCDNPLELKQWKEALQQELSGAVPGILRELEIVDCKQYPSTIEAMRKRVVSTKTAGICRLVDSDAYPALFRQVYRAFGGGKIYVGDLLQQQSEDLVTEIQLSSNLNDAFVLDGADLDMERELINLADELIDEIQIKQEETWLQDGLPVNFAAVVNPRLLALSRAVTARGVPDVVRESVVRHVQSRIEHLYLSQLESLREQYGKMYEAMLDKLGGKSGDSPALTDDDMDAWKDAAARVSEKFRKAAQHAVPALCQSTKLFGYSNDDKWNYHRTLTESGLISDMMEATELRYDDLDVLEEDDFLGRQQQRGSSGTAEAGEDIDTLSSSVSAKSSSSSSKNNKRRKRGKLRLRKWHEKLAARAFVIGVNYLQGWLAWQGIKRAALLREQQMPKFPLF